VRDRLLAGLADNGKKWARCLLLSHDRTFVGDVRSSEMCQQETHALQQLVSIGVVSTNTQIEVFSAEAD
jgi:hypothetical protein